MRSCGLTSLDCSCGLSMRDHISSRSLDYYMLPCVSVKILCFSFVPLIKHRRSHCLMILYRQRKLCIRKSIDLTIKKKPIQASELNTTIFMSTNVVSIEFLVVVFTFYYLCCDCHFHVVTTIFTHGWI